jgi:hypothetical protein
VVSALAAVRRLLPLRVPNNPIRGQRESVLSSLRRNGALWTAPRSRIGRDSTPNTETDELHNGKKKAVSPSSKLTETEQDLLSHMQNGYELETDSLGSDPILRRLKDNEVIRPLSADCNTIEAMKQRGLITSAKGRDPLTIVWRLTRQK